MKKFVKGRWFPPFAVAIAAVIVALVMALFGWKITYAPDLENNWNAISAVAAWAGVAMSFVAIMIAIWIPKRIADRQDKIALFEKRYSAYSEILNVLSLAKDFEHFHKCTLYEYFIGVLLTLNYPEPESMTPNTFIYHLKIDYTTSLIKQSAFLFPNIQKDDADELSKEFRHFFVCLETVPSKQKMNVEKYRKEDASMADFFKISEFFSNKYLNAMETYLSFKRD